MWPFHRKCRSSARLDGKTAVITGSSTGIGKCTVLDFVTRGCRVVMACVDLDEANDAAEEIRGATSGVEGVGVVSVVHLDLASFASVRECAENLLKTESQINLLINNAGVAFHPKTISEDGFELHFAVNYLGHFLLTLLLLPKILSSAPARIINVGSLIHLMGSINFDDINGLGSYNSVGAYSRSKLALLLFTRELAEKLKGTGVAIFCIHPGFVKSSLFRTLDKILFRGAARVVLTAAVPLGKTPKQGAQTTIYCAVDEKVTKHSGSFISDCKRSWMEPRARDPAVARCLWKETLKWVGVEDFSNAQDGTKK